MGDLRVAPKPKPLEQLADQKLREIFRGSVLNWDCLETPHVRELAANVRAASTLAQLACAGLHEQEFQPDDFEEALVMELLSLASQGARLLARKLDKEGAA